jgi:predicted nucleic acid-binding protein
VDVCVIDASIIIQYFVTQPLTAQATTLIRRLHDEPSFHVRAPDFIYAECASAFWKYVRFTTYDRRVAWANMADILLFPIITTSAHVLADRALGLGLDYEISAYDACYVALADIIGCPLITADQRLIRQMAGSDMEVQWLGDL